MMKVVLLLLALCVATSLAGKLPNCGKTPIRPDTTEDKIVGGKDARPYSWPWQVFLCKAFDTDPTYCSPECGGSIIDNQWILSAAHCEVDLQKYPGQWYAKVGMYNQSRDDEPGEVIFNVTQVVVHPSYGTPKEGSNDISLFKIDGKIKFTKHIQPICIPQSVSDIVHNGSFAFVTGWGTMSEGGVESETLKQVKVPFLDMSICIKEYGEEDIDDTMECAGKAGLDSCQGDSGGPLVTQHSNGRWFQAGIVSWGRGCAEEGYAGVYSSPSANCDFIASTIGYKICQ